MARTKQPVTKKCLWQQDDEGNWHTGCRNIYIILEGTPEDNRMAYCCYCGGVLRQKCYREAA